MSKPKAIFNGEFIEADELALPVSDAGFVLGVTIAEQIRTFGGRLFRLDEHLRRLENSLRIVGVSLPHDAAALKPLAEELVAHNWALGSPEADIGLCIFVTPGGYSTLDPEGSPPRLAMHTYPIPFHFWADKFQTGERLSVVDVRQVPTECWPAELKCRSRMHYYLADKQAREIDPRSRALLLDVEGYVCEASTANVVLYRDGEGIVCPLPEKILPGISVAVLEELAKAEGITWTNRNIGVEELQSADEILLSSTSICTLPVSVIHTPQGTRELQPGPVYRRMLERWNDLVGLEVAEQARRCC